MRKRDFALKAGIAAAALLVAGLALGGCASGSRGVGEAAVCPKCGVKAVKIHMHKRLGKGFVHYWRRRHEHVKYVCPRCAKEWSGPPEKKAGEKWVCPRCGCALRECPVCFKGAAGKRG